MRTPLFLLVIVIALLSVFAFFSAYKFSLLGLAQAVITPPKLSLAFNAPQLPTPPAFPVETPSLSPAETPAGNNQNVVSPDTSAHLIFTTNTNDELFLSPDKKFVAVTKSTYSYTATHIIDISGKTVTRSYLGGAVAWSPDSKNVFVADSETKEGRKILSIGLNGNYTDLGLPAGAGNADMSPDGEKIIFALTDNAADQSDLMVRDVQSGHDHVLLKGSVNGSIFAWPRWSPDGTRLAVVEVDIPTLRRTLLVLAESGAVEGSVPGVVWEYPPIWSQDGSKVLISVQENNDPGTHNPLHPAFAGNIYEYGIAKASAQPLTAFLEKRVFYPSYAADGSVVFISNESGADEVWDYRDGAVRQLTTDGRNKWYPISY